MSRLNKSQEGSIRRRKSGSGHSHAHYNGWNSRSRLRPIQAHITGWRGLDYDREVFFHCVSICSHENGGGDRHGSRTVSPRRRALVLAPSQCFEAALANGTDTILLFPAGRLWVDKPLAASTAALCPVARPFYVGKREKEQLMKAPRLAIQRKDVSTKRGA